MNEFIAKELWFTMEKLWFYGKNYGCMEKKYVTIPKTMELWFTIEKNYGTMDKTMVLFWGL